MTRPGTQSPPTYAVAVDLLVLTLRNDRLAALLIERGVAPYAGRMALPGGFVLPGEDLIDAAWRELREETGFRPSAVRGLEQLRTYGAPGRDPRPERVISVAWVVLGAGLPDPRGGSDAADARWVAVEEIDPDSLAFDHGQILRDGIERARAKLEYTGLASAFLDPEFTVAQLRGVYEAVWGERLDPGNFQRKVTGTPGFLTPVSGQRSSGRGRPAQLFRADPGVELNPPLRRGGRAGG